MKNSNSRRDFLKKSAALATLLMAAQKGVLGTIANASTSKSAIENNSLNFFEENVKTSEDGKFLLPILPYSFDALEPHIDKLTMEIHYSKHHQAYVTNLNKALETIDPSILGGIPTFDNIFDKVAKLPPAVRNNAGGHYNHSLFWILMLSNTDKHPTGKLADAINDTYGTFDEFKKQFSDLSMKRFGSGWAWLVVNKGKLVMGSTANQDNPLMNLDSVEIKGTPVLALDLWEHAYYLKNQNRRAEYIASWWNVVNWEVAESLFLSAK